MTIGNKDKVYRDNDNPNEEELMARIAWFYYRDGLTQGDIANQLKINRIKVSRLLEKGRRSGVIRVQINSRYEGCLRLEYILQQHFKLKYIRVLPELETNVLNDRLGVGTANLLMSILEPGELLAVGFGDTANHTLQNLSGFICSQKIKLVTLSGGVGSYAQGIGQLDASCQINIIPAPLRTSSAEVAELLRQEKDVRDVLMIAQAAQVAVVGIGALQQKKQATIILSGYITEAEQLMFEQKGAVGDILGNFIQKDGKLADDMPIHNELIGISLTELNAIPVVIGVAGGVDKSEAIIAALKGKHINSLVTDENTARNILKILRIENKEEMEQMII